MVADAGEKPICRTVDAADAVWVVWRARWLRRRMRRVAKSLSGEPGDPPDYLSEALVRLWELDPTRVEWGRDEKYVMSALQNRMRRAFNGLPGGVEPEELWLAVGDSRVVIIPPAE